MSNDHHQDQQQQNQGKKKGGGGGGAKADGISVSQSVDSSIAMASGNVSGHIVSAFTNATAYSVAVLVMPFIYKGLSFAWSKVFGIKKGNVHAGQAPTDSSPKNVGELWKIANALDLKDDKTANQFRTFIKKVSPEVGLDPQDTVEKK